MPDDLVRSAKVWCAANDTTMSAITEVAFRAALSLPGDLAKKAKSWCDFNDTTLAKVIETALKKQLKA
jgi:hypothetical protein